jgi:hypothetical protein
MNPLQSPRLSRRAGRRPVAGVLNAGWLRCQCGRSGAIAKAAEAPMGTVTTADGTEIFYKDWGSGQPIVFSHGWPLSADDWDTQMLFFLQHGYRVDLPRIPARHVGLHDHGTPSANIADGVP